MKTMWPSILVYLLFPVSVLAGEISFLEVETKEDWEKTLRRAKEQNSMVFVDVYATWCGPCKAMDQEVYSDDAVGAFFNTTFLNVKMDGETTFGETFMVDYEIDAYPTYVFFNAEGELINTASGFMQAEAFLDLGKATLDVLGKRAEWETRYQKGELSVDDMTEYADFLSRVRNKNKARAIITNYLSGFETAELLPYKPWTLLKTYALDLDDALLRRVISEKEAFVYMRGAEEVQSYYNDVLQYNLTQAVQAKDEPDIELLERALSVLLPVMFKEGQEKEAAGKALATRQSFYLMSEDPANYIRVTDAYIDQYAAGDPGFLLQVVEKALVMENAGLYEASERWAQRAYEIEDSFNAAMYYVYAMALNDHSEAALKLLKQLEERFSEEPEYLNAIEDLRNYVEENR